MKLSCRDNSFPLLSLDCALRIIADLGIPGVDISISGRHRQLPPSQVLAQPNATAERVRALVESTNLRVADVFFLTGASRDLMPVNSPDPEEEAEAQRQFEAVLVFARELDAGGITILPGQARKDEESSSAWRRAVAGLRHRVERAGEEGFRLSVEPHVGSLIPTPVDTMRLLQDVPGLALTLDCSHFISAGNSQEETELLIPHCRHVQGRQAAQGHLQSTAARGSIDFTRFIRRLEVVAYDGWFGIEYTWNNWIDEVDTIAQTALLRDLFLAVRSPEPAPEVRNAFPVDPERHSVGA